MIIKSSSFESIVVNHFFREVLDFSLVDPSHPVYPRLSVVNFHGLISLLPAARTIRFSDSQKKVHKIPSASSPDLPPPTLLDPQSSPPNPASRLPPSPHIPFVPRKMRKKVLELPLPFPFSPSPFSSPPPVRLGRPCRPGLAYNKKCSRRFIYINLVHLRLSVVKIL